MSETPREPDRFEAKARELLHEIRHGVLNMEQAALHLAKVAAALRAEHDDALESVLTKVNALIAEFGQNPESALSIVSGYIDETLHGILRIRALASPAAAPTAAFACGADMESDGHLYRCDRGADHTGPHGERDYAEWTDETHHDAPPSEPAAPAHDLRCEACGDRLADEDAMHAHDRTWHGAAEAEVLDRIAELEAALRELTRAATEHANAHGCSGDLGARLSDAKAFLAARTSPPGAGEGKT